MYGTTIVLSRRTLVRAARALRENDEHEQADEISEAIDMLDTLDEHDLYRRSEIRYELDVLSCGLGTEQYSDIDYDL